MSNSKKNEAKVSSSELDRLIKALREAIFEASKAAVVAGWKPKTMRQVRRHLKSHTATRIEFPEELLPDGRTLGFFADLVRESAAEVVESCLDADEVLLRRLDNLNCENRIDKVWRIRSSASVLIQDFAREFVGDSVDFYWDQARFDIAVSALRTFLDSDHQRFTVRTPLMNFEMSQEIFEFDDVRIENAQNQDVERLFNSQKDLSTLDAIPWTSCKLLVLPQFTIRPEESSRELAVKFVERLSSVLTSIRLVTDGAVDIGDIWVERLGPQFGFRFDNYVAKDFALFVGDKAKLEINRETSALLPMLARLVHQENGAGSMAKTTSLAVKRFNVSYQRHLQEDRILDLTIALEALFSEDQTELTDKISRRVGRLLGSTKNERVELKRMTRDLYYLRSRIVHGVDMGSEDLTKDLADLQSIVRKSVILKLTTQWTIAQLELEMMG